MSTKHTPGPWVILGDNVGCATGHIAFTSCNPRTIDETRPDGESWLDMRERTKAARESLAREVTANARLIAAAPELLAVVQELFSLEDTLLRDIYGSDFVAAARAAIAKATGEQA